MKLLKVSVGNTSSTKVNGVEVNIFRKTKHTYVVLSSSDKKICSGPSLPKAIAKAEGIIEKPKAVKPKKAVTSKPKSNTSMKSICLDMIIINSLDEDIVTAVKEEFPDAKFNMSHVSWYRSTMFRDGVIGPEHAPRRSKAYKLWKENQAK